MKKIQLINKLLLSLAVVSGSIFCGPMAMRQYKYNLRKGKGIELLEAYQAIMSRSSTEVARDKASVNSAIDYQLKNNDIDIRGALKDIESSGKTLDQFLNDFDAIKNTANGKKVLKLLGDPEGTSKVRSTSSKPLGSVSSSTSSSKSTTNVSGFQKQLENNIKQLRVALSSQEEKEAKEKKDVTRNRRSNEV